MRDDKNTARFRPRMGRRPPRAEESLSLRKLLLSRARNASRRARLAGRTSVAVWRPGEHSRRVMVKTHVVRMTLDVMVVDVDGRILPTRRARNGLAAAASSRVDRCSRRRSGGSHRPRQTEALPIAHDAAIARRPTPGSYLNRRTSRILMPRRSARSFRSARARTKLRRTLEKYLDGV
jgi:hypothetical protein